ncbi:MAG: hypothetical protein ACRBF0_19715 [Calditrichia bacterium]
MRRFTQLLFTLCLMFGSLNADPVTIDAQNWDISGKENGVVQHLGRTAFELKAGRAVHKTMTFENGIIEFDVSFPAARNFVGVMWRMQDGGNFEEFYMRPHQSGKGDANQYTPVFNGNSGWQLYHGEGYAAPTEYVFDKWMPVKIVVAGNRAAVYIKDMQKPAFTTHEFKRKSATGQIGFKSGPFAKAYISNVRVTSNVAPKLSGDMPTIEPAPTHTIMSYQVSTHFPESRLENVTKLEDKYKNNVEWQELSCEANGTANLSRVQTHRGDNNTAFVKVTIESAGEQLKKLRFGYSDRVRVYINDALVYSGNNAYRSRDFRYLGTIGLFDAIYLPLQKGKNEVLFAVSETFGGWGILSQLEEVKGIQVSNRLQSAVEK